MSIDTSWQDGAAPPVGRAFYYLVAGASRCGEGSRGTDGAGHEIPPGAPACAITDWDSDGDGVYDPDDGCAQVATPNQLDGDRDGRPNACDDCPSVFNPDQADTDVVPDVSDCASLINSVSAIPGEVGQTLTQILGGAPGGFRFTPIVQANVHNLYRGTTSIHFSFGSGPLCMSPELTAATFTDT